MASAGEQRENRQSGFASPRTDGSYSPVSISSMDLVDNEFDTEGLGEALMSETMGKDLDDALHELPESKRAFVEAGLRQCMRGFATHVNQVFAAAASGDVAGPNAELAMRAIFEPSTGTTATTTAINAFTATTNTNTSNTATYSTTTTSVAALMGDVQSAGGNCINKTSMSLLPSATPSVFCSLTHNPVSASVSTTPTVSGDDVAGVECERQDAKGSPPSSLFASAISFSDFAMPSSSCVANGKGVSCGGGGGGSCGEDGVIPCGDVDLVQDASHHTSACHSRSSSGTQHPQRDNHHRSTDTTSSTAAASNTTTSRGTRKSHSSSRGAAARPARPSAGGAGVPPPTQPPSPGILMRIFAALMRGVRSVLAALASGWKAVVRWLAQHLRPFLQRWTRETVASSSARHFSQGGGAVTSAGSSAPPPAVSAPADATAPMATAPRPPPAASALGAGGNGTIGIAGGNVSAVRSLGESVHGVAETIMAGSMSV